MENKQPDTIHFLPVYDEFIMGYKDRSAILTLKNGAPFRYDSMILSGGQVVGTWKRTMKKNAIDMEADLFKPLSKSQNRAFTEAIDRFSNFTKLKVNR